MSDLCDSDCASHNEPAYLNSPCDCSFRQSDLAKIMTLWKIGMMTHKEAMLAIFKSYSSNPVIGERNE